MRREGTAYRCVEIIEKYSSRFVRLTWKFHWRGRNHDVNVIQAGKVGVEGMGHACLWGDGSLLKHKNALDQGGHPGSLYWEYKSAVMPRMEEHIAITYCFAMANICFDSSYRQG
jgi:hypothetical protein